MKLAGIQIVNGIFKANLLLGARKTNLFCNVSQAITLIMSDLLFPLIALSLQMISIQS